MNLVISESMKKRIARNRTRLNLSETEYVRNALAHYDHLIFLNAQLREELALWERASSSDFDAWARKHHA